MYSDITFLLCPHFRYFIQRAGLHLHYCSHSPGGTCRLWLANGRLSADSRGSAMYRKESAV